MIKFKFLIFICCSAIPAVAAASISLPSVFGDNMVLQQNSDARIWGWSTPGSVVTVTASWAPDSEVSAQAGENGRWILEIPTPEASFTPQTVSVSGDGSDITINNVLVGEVWFCSGQSNMEMMLRGFATQPVEGAAEAIAYSGNYPGIRVATVRRYGSYIPQDSVESPWKVSNPANAAEFTALGYFFAKALTDILHVPVGIINSSYGGTKVEAWQSREQLAKYPECDVDKEAADSSINEWDRINVMYNAMLHPLTGYTIKGFLWNQGESNVGQHDTYPEHLRDMVKEWRDKWNCGELPFYFVEIPGWIYSGADNTEAALFRECQHLAADIIPNSGIVCTSDLIYPFELHDIHGRKKKEIGERMAFMAAAKTYGLEGIPYTYPKYKSMTVHGDKALLSFYNAPFGFTPSGELEGFEAAGKDGIFHPAAAREVRNPIAIEVSCPDVGEIKAVRYNFKNFAVGKVHDLMGMPLIPFRTDNW